MAYCTEEGDGKDRVIFATKEDLDTPSKAVITVDDEEENPGLVLPNGDLNWDCPCVEGLLSGPCGYSFKESFTCFHYSTTDPKGQDCAEKFKEFSDCLEKNSVLKARLDYDDEQELTAFENEADNQSHNSVSSSDTTLTNEKKS